MCLLYALMNYIPVQVLPGLHPDQVLPSIFCAGYPIIRRRNNIPCFVVGWGGMRGFAFPLSFFLISCIPNAYQNYLLAVPIYRLELSFAYWYLIQDFLITNLEQNQTLRILLPVFHPLLRVT